MDDRKREWQDSGYETIRVSLDEARSSSPSLLKSFQDSWTRPLTRMEQRHIAFLQQETRRGPLKQGKKVESQLDLDANVAPDLLTAHLYT